MNFIKNNDLDYYYDCSFDDDKLGANILVIKGCGNQFWSAATEVAEHGEGEVLPVAVVPVPVEVVHHEVLVV